MPFWSRLFGSKPAEEAPSTAEDYKGFTVIPTPRPEGGQFRVSARIEKVVNGTPQRHELVRADLIASRDEAMAISAGKARQLIDEQGDRLFDPR
jgi:hypothetical protein